MKEKELLIRSSSLPSFKKDLKYSLLELKKENNVKLQTIKKVLFQVAKKKCTNLATQIKLKLE